MILKVLNYIFVFFYTIECVLKAIGMGLRPFLRVGFNVFDLVIVIASLQGVYFEVTGQEGSTYFTVLRTFRVMRVLKLFRIGDLRVLIDSITYTLPVIVPYVFLLVFFIYIFSLVGMSFYAGKIKLDDNFKPDLINGTAPRNNYDSLG